MENEEPEGNQHTYAHRGEQKHWKDSEMLIPTKY